MGDSREFSRRSSDMRMRNSLLGFPCGRRTIEVDPDQPSKGDEEMKMVKCPLCGMEVPELMYALHEATDEMVISHVQARFPGWRPQDGVCEPCMERFRQLEGNAA